MPPHGVTIHLSVTEQGDYKWDNPDLNFHAEDDDTDVIQHQKSERIVYPCEQTTDTEIETKLLRLSLKNFRRSYLDGTPDAEIVRLWEHMNMMLDDTK